MVTVLTARGEGPDPTALVASLAADSYELAPAAPTTTTVLDTFDGLLHAAGLRLVHRGGSLVLTGAGVVPAQLAVTTRPRFANDLPPGPFRNRLHDVTTIRALLPLLTLSSDTTQVTRRNAIGKIVVGAELHERLTTGRGDVAGWYVRVDELAGYPGPAAELADLVRDVGGRPVDGDIVDIALAVAGIDPAGHRGDPSVPLDPHLPALDGFRSVLANLAVTIDATRAGTIDDIDPEFLHDFRVAVRRTRSVLRHGKKVLPADVLAWSGDGFRSLGYLTGAPRDLDVYVIEWNGYVAGLPADVVRALQPVRDHLDTDRVLAHADLAANLRSGDVTALLGRWSAWLRQPVDLAAAGPHADRRLDEIVKRRIETAQRQLLAHGRVITPATPAEDVHELRKDAKKLRYLLECFGGLLPDVERKAFVKRLKALQDNLGEHQDAEVHVAQLRRAVDELPATTSPDTFVAIGQLIEQLEQRREDARDEFAGRFADYDRPKTRRAFDAVVAGIGG